VNKIIEKINRPPIGFIVEGQGEYNCYPSLICRTLCTDGFKIPIVNANGIGGMVSKLHDHLKYLVLADHPCNVIVTADLRDIIDRKLYLTCEEARTDLENEAKNWLIQAQTDDRLQPLPERIIVVIQVQVFESWIISDIPNLARAGYIDQGEKQIRSVDQKILNPVKWLKERLDPNVRLKNPKKAKEIISQLDPNLMRRNSRSFDKFCKEITWGYESWARECELIS